jgi:hypothetical protein
MWMPWEGAGLEHLFLLTNEEGVFADGVVIGLGEGEPYRVRYRIRCDTRWRVRELVLKSLQDQGREVRLLADGEGRWWTVDGESLPSLEGCIDVDISTTPFTNTLPIRRLGLGPGEREEIRVAYANIPDMTVRPENQRYTCLEHHAGGGRYKYQSLNGSGFTADLPVDDDGLVLNYPGLFRRVGS